MSKETYKLLQKIKQVGNLHISQEKALFLYKRGYVVREYSDIDTYGNEIYTGFVHLTEDGKNYIENYRRQRHTSVIAWIGAITGGISLLMSILNTLKILQII